MERHFATTLTPAVVLLLGYRSYCEILFQISASETSWITTIELKPLSCWTRIYPAFANSEGPDHLAFQKPIDLDLHCFSFNMWIYIDNLD